ncbi:hypothetical protein DL93DRAFT_2232698 [Clavulina sp. PMI_390]|nr:hypothetical protein DL93DRAFT_2232698 [Clavulina sp. PMI_390]
MLDDALEDFFTEDDGTNPLRRLPFTNPSPSNQGISKFGPSVLTRTGTRSSDTSESRVGGPSDHSSIASTATFFSRIGVIELSLADVCHFIDDGAALRDARIVSVNGYREPAGPVAHRFIVLHLHRSQRKDIWLRLDRRRGQGISLFKFVMGSGVTKANDRATLSADQAQLVQQASLETSRSLQNRPTLRDLSRLLRIVNEELLRYRIWPENCWFFCSLIQQHLAGATLAHQPDSEWFIESRVNIQHVKLGKGIRERVFQRYWGDMQPPFNPYSPQLSIYPGEPMHPTPQVGIPYPLMELEFPPTIPPGGMTPGYITPPWALGDAEPAQFAPVMVFPDNPSIPFPTAQKFTGVVSYPDTMRGLELGHRPPRKISNTKLDRDDGFPEPPVVITTGGMTFEVYGAGPGNVIDVSHLLALADTLNPASGESVGSYVTADHATPSGSDMMRSEGEDKDDCSADDESFANDREVEMGDEWEWHSHPRTPSPVFTNSDYEYDSD